MAHESYMTQLLLWLQLFMRASGHDSNRRTDRQHINTHTYVRHTVRAHALIPCAQLHLDLHAVLSSAVLWDHFATALFLSVKINMPSR